MGRLATEFQLMDEPGQAEACLVEVINSSPDSAQPRLALASHYHLHCGDLEKALVAVNTAVEVAAKSGSLFRQAHGSRIRVALDLKEFQLVQESLEALIAYKPESGAVDVALERDFLKRIPAGSVSPAVLIQYEALVERDGT